MPVAGPLAEVSLSIPSRPEYVGVARLAILGVASRMRFSYDEVEDIRLAVGEACTRAIDRLDGGPQEHAIDIRCLIDANRLTIEVRHPLIPSTPPVEAPADPVNIDPVELGGVLIRILMDEVETIDRAEEGVQLLRMVKYVAR
ncbi:MAG: ATP-binding protein [Armatimonadota bacterium]